MAVGAAYGAYAFYKKHGVAGDQRLQSRLGGLYRSMSEKFYFDELYDALFTRPLGWLGQKVLRPFDEKVVDGFVNGTSESIGSVGEVFRRMQTGLVQNYLLILSLGVVLMLAYLIFAPI